MIRATISILAALGGASGAAPGAELLRDPGFERVSEGRAEGWAPYEKGYAVDREVRRGGAASIRCGLASVSERAGAVATVELAQTEPAPLLVTGWSRAEGVSGFANNDYSIYVDLTYADGTPLWGQTAPFSAGTHDWEARRVLIFPAKPLRRAHVHALFRHHTGAVWFDDFSLVELRGTDVFDGQVFPAPALPPGASCGWFVRDVAAASPALPAIPGPAGEGAVEALGLRVAAREEGPSLRARIEDATGKPRAVTLYYVERFEAEAVLWWNDIRDAQPVVSRAAGERANLARIHAGATGSVSLYPFGCVTGRAPGKGPASPEGARAATGESGPPPADVGRLLGLAPFQGPRVARIAFHPAARLFYVACDFALDGANLANSDGAGRGRADLEVVRADVDPAWGFRAAAKRYYELFPDAFERRAEAEGIWIPFTDPSTVRGLEDFGIAYHEGDNSIASDDRLGILSFRYTEPMTWWMPMEKGVPRDYETALAIVRKLAEGPEGSARRHAQAVLDSGAHDEGGRFRVEFVAAPWTDGAVWVLNPNPGLPAAPERWTKAKLSYTAELAEKLYGPERGGVQDGEYLDSIEGWADVLDFRPESIRHASSPPVFATESLRTAIPTWFSVWEFAVRVRDDLRRRGKLLMANATPWRIHAFAPLLDVMGTETNWMPGGRWQPDSDAVFNLRRTLSYKKPYLLLQNTDFDRFGAREVERYFARSLFYGVYPSMFSVDASTHPYWTEPRWYERDRELFRRYIPPIRRLSEAGWEPVTRARAEGGALWVERFGTRLFTVFNPASEPKESEIAVEAAKLGISGAVEVFDFLRGEAVTRLEPPAGAPGARELRFSVSVGPEEVRALELRPPSR